MCFPNACDDPSAKRAQYEVSTTVNDKCQGKQALLTFSSHIIGPQLVAAITVFVLFTVELQHLGSLIKILPDPFQIVYQPITTCEKRIRAFLFVWGHCLAEGRVKV